MESSQLPLVIPMWLTGFETLMPEGRPFPYKYIPRLGAQLSVSFGDPIPPEELMRAISLKINEEEARIRVTSIVHDHVERLGWNVRDSSLRTNLNP